MTITSPSRTPPLRISSTAASWLSTTRAGPENFRIDSSTPAVLTTQPSSAMLPYRIASPPSLECACSTSRMQPSAASVSSVSQRSDWLNAVAERTQPGAAWKSSIASSVAVGFGISTAAHARAVAELADGVIVGSRVVRAAGEDGPEAVGELVSELASALR